jgi:hypothetical protein
MNWPKALKGGLLGGLNVTILLLVLRTLGITSLNLEMILGSLVTKRIEVAPWFLGLAMHLGFAAIFGVLYGAVMERAQRRGMRIGIILAGAHAVASGLLLPLFALIHPLLKSGRIPQPGFFAANLGALTVAIFVAVHLLYGIIVGELYRLRARPQTEEELLQIARHRPEEARR